MLLKDIMVAGILASLLFSSFAVFTLASNGQTLWNIKQNWKATSLDWNATTDPCNDHWQGVTCDINQRVIALNLTNKGLNGPVPDDISSLESLVSLDVSNSIYSTGPWNKITGDLSPIGNLVNLQILNVSFNILNREFPDAVLKLTNLVALRLDNAHLIGQFPTGLKNLVNLKYLYLGNNSMIGGLPRELGNLLNLVELTLWNNSFNSKIPSELGNLRNLTYLNLHDCLLWGGLPVEFGNLKSIQLLYLYDNELTGVIPDIWQNMKNLRELRLQKNYHTKYFPSWALNLPSLQKLDISNNFLYGNLPNLNFTSLTSVNVKCNYFSGIRSGLKPVVSNSGNCFTNINQSQLQIEKDKCYQFYSCTEFFKRVPNGGCPQCPQYQFLVDQATCVCELANGTPAPESSKIWKIVGPIGGVALLIVVSVLAYHKWRRFVKRKIIARFKRNISRKELDEFWEAPKGVQRFTFEELAKATGNFDCDHEVGVGGFGKVFYGILENGKKVAIKRASAQSLQGSSEFRNEVLLLSRLHHRNLVRLEGFCEDEGLQILVYEYMANGNLHTRLFQNDANQILSWYRRLEIAVGIAQGLDYLHSFADPPVIHRDVKPSNVLLDDNLVAKLADFGISRATLDFETHISTTPAGTAGYIDPEYFLRRQLTTASDVYGFGVVLLELLTGQKAIDHSRLEEHNLVEWVKIKSKVESIEDILDPRMGNKYPQKVFFDVVQLAVDCASFNKNDRPTMKVVVSVLEACLWSAGPPPSETIWQPSESHYKQPPSDYSETSMRDTSTSMDAAMHSNFKDSIILPR